MGCLECMHPPSQSILTFASVSSVLEVSGPGACSVFLVAACCGLTSLVEGVTVDLAEFGIRLEFEENLGIKAVRVGI